MADTRHKITHLGATETACGITWDNSADVVIRPLRSPDWMLTTCQDCLKTRPTVVAGGWCAPSETIYQLGTGESSRETMLWHGLVEPTQEERQKAADELYEQETLDNRNWFDTGVMLGKVEQMHFGPLAKAILALHRRDERHNFCVQCDDERVVMWPCATVRVVLHSVGIKVPEEVIYDKPKPVVQDNDNPRWPFPAKPLTQAEIFGFPEVSTRRGGISFGGGHV
jgi:hypothetical protein